MIPNISLNFPFKSSKFSIDQREFPFISGFLVLSYVETVRKTSNFIYISSTPKKFENKGKFSYISCLYISLSFRNYWPVKYKFMFFTLPHQAGWSYLKPSQNVHVCPSIHPSVCPTPSPQWFPNDNLRRYWSMLFLILYIYWVS